MKMFQTEIDRKCQGNCKKCEYINICEAYKISNIAHDYIKTLKNNIKIKYDLDIAYDYGIKKVPKIQLENRGYKIIKQLSDTEFIIKNSKIIEPYITIKEN